ncbi:unnamed protein product [Parascedosporium putredinis]|uniref:MFS general substrate transporter n=1 Tax=Parascedosporium putredinis TaxID=1442378 RepID=A0A9P1MBS7_9PEZI|nr:unnamed protein product [Parascedosporium putredinis]CAI7996826.1 unnamed protein product [Parascedosporium putredinis]
MNEKNPVTPLDPENGPAAKHQHFEIASEKANMTANTERALEAQGRELHELPISYCLGGFGLISPLITYINNDIGPSDNILWVSLAWLLLQAITYLIVGRLTDIFGRRWFFIIGSCIGLIGSIFGAVAQTVNQLIGSMVFLGISAGIMLCFFWASAEIVPMKYRYLANVGTYIFSIPTNPLAPKLAYWFQAETKVSAPVIGTLVAGAVGTALCILWELKLPFKDVDPFFPLHLFRNGRYMAVSWLTGFASCNYYAFVLLWPAAVTNIYTVEGNYLSTMFALPAMSFVFGQIAGGIVANFTGPKLPTIGFMIIATPLLGAAATNPLNMSMTMAFVITGCFTVGAADAIAITTTTFPIRSQEEIGTAGGLSGFIRLFVPTISVAVYSTVLANKLTTTLPARISKAVADTSFPNSSIPALISAFQGTSSFGEVPGITDQVIELGQQGFRSGYSDAIRIVFLTNLAFCGVAVILSFFVANNDASKDNFVAGHIHTKADEQALEQQEK